MSNSLIKGIDKDKWSESKENIAETIFEDVKTSSTKLGVTV